jgi:flagellar hook assembly protein FlgD
LPAASRVTVMLYNILGQRVATLVAQEKQAGIHRIRWRGEGDNGNQLSSGIYFLRVTAGGTAFTRKMMLIR